MKGVGSGWSRQTCQLHTVRLLRHQSSIIIYFLIHRCTQDLQWIGLTMVDPEIFKGTELEGFEDVLQKLKQNVKLVYIF